MRRRSAAPHGTDKAETETPINGGSGGALVSLEGASLIAGVSGELTADGVGGALTGDGVGGALGACNCSVGAVIGVLGALDGAWEMRAV